MYVDIVLHNKNIINYVYEKGIHWSLNSDNYNDTINKIMASGSNSDNRKSVTFIVLLQARKILTLL